MEHKFFKINDEWSIHCPVTGGCFSVEMWKSGKIRNNYCPCCKCDISIQLRTQKTKKLIAAGVQNHL